MHGLTGLKGATPLAFKRGTFPSRELIFPENTAKTVSLLKMAAKQAMKEIDRQ